MARLPLQISPADLLSSSYETALRYQKDLGTCRKLLITLQKLRLQSADSRLFKATQNMQLLILHLHVQRTLYSYPIHSSYLDTQPESISAGSTTLSRFISRCARTFRRLRQLLAGRS